MVNETSHGNVIMIPPSANWYLPKVSSVNLDGSLFAYAANCSIVVFKIISTGLHVSLIHGHHMKVNTVAYLPVLEGRGSSWIVSGSQDGSVRVWHSETGNCLSMHSNHNQSVICCSVSPSNPFVVFTVDENGIVIVWRIPEQQMNGMEVIVNQGHYQTLDTTSFGVKSKICIIHCHPVNEEEIIIGYQTGVILIVNWLKGNIVQRLLGHVDSICSFSFCPIPSNIQDSDSMNDDAPLLMASGSKDKTLRIWNVNTGRCVFSHTLVSSKKGKGRNNNDSRQRFWMGCTWNPYNPLQLVVSSNNGDLLLFSAKLTSTKDIGEDILNHNSFYKLVEGDIESTLQWTLSSFGVGKKGARHSRAVFCLDFVNTNQFFTVSMDRQIGQWNIETMKPIQMIHCSGGHVYSLHTNSLQPACLAMGIGDQSILLWNPPRLKKGETHGDQFDIKFIWRGIQSKVTSIQWHPVKEVFFSKRIVMAFLTFFTGIFGIWH